MHRVSRNHSRVKNCSACLFCCEHGARRNGVGTNGEGNRTVANALREQTVQFTAKQKAVLILIGSISSSLQFPTQNTTETTHAHNHVTSLQTYGQPCHLNPDLRPRNIFDNIIFRANIRGRLRVWLTKWAHNPKRQTHSQRHLNPIKDAWSVWWAEEKRALRHAVLVCACDTARQPIEVQLPWAQHNLHNNSVLLMVYRPMIKASIWRR